MRDIMHFQAAARAYLQRKTGGCDEDILSEMVLYALEHPETSISLKYAYLGARDKLDPRRVLTPNGKKERISRRTRTLGSLARPEVEDAVHPLDSLPSPAGEPTGEPWQEIKIQHGPLRAMVLLVSVYGYSMAEIAWLFGMSPQRLSQQLGRGKCEVLAGGVPERNFEFSAPSFDLPWIRL